MEIMVYREESHKKIPPANQEGLYISRSIKLLFLEFGVFRLELVDTTS